LEEDTVTIMSLEETDTATVTSLEEETGSHDSTERSRESHTDAPSEGRYDYDDVTGVDDVIERRTTTKRVIGGDKLKIVDVTTREFIVKLNRNQYYEPFASL